MRKKLTARNLTKIEPKLIDLPLEEKISKLCNNELPKYVRYKIAKELDVFDILNLCQTNKKCNELCKDDSFWKMKFKDTLVDETKPENIDYLNWYKILYDHGVFDLRYRDLIDFAIKNKYIKLAIYAVNDDESDKTIYLPIENIVKYDFLEFVKYLFENTDFIEDELDYILAESVINNKNNIAKYVLDNGADVNYKFVREGAKYAINKRYSDIIHTLIDYGLIIDKSYIIFAVKTEQYDLAKYLLDKGLEIGIVNDL